MTNVNDIKKLVKDIQTHYEKHLNNKYVKNIYSKINLPVSTSQEMAMLLESEVMYIDSKGALEDIYAGIRAVSYFIDTIEKNIIPNISSYSNINLLTSNPSENDKILFQMAIKNYPQNIKIFKDMIKNLFIMIYDFDKLNFSKDPAFKKVKNFYELERLYLQQQ